MRKVSRACDSCKARRIRCSGTKPCDTCTRRGAACHYDATYTRGKPPTPLPSLSSPPASILEQSAPVPDQHLLTARPAVSSRNSPELGTADVDGQYVDPTSGFSFLHRARKRISRLRSQNAVQIRATDASEQPWIAAGDNALLGDASAWVLPSPENAAGLIDTYFEVCAPTYRFLHRPTFDRWLQTVLQNQQQNLSLGTGLGEAKLATVLGILAIAHIHQRPIEHPAHALLDPLLQGDSLICQAMDLTDTETGLPSLSSVQARLAQTFYFCMTSRFNRAWYVFGTCLQMISALGLHRRSIARHSADNTNYIKQQSRKRTFWTAYILDKYLGVVFGRPPHFHDQDIDQEPPDRVNDENMTAEGPDYDDFNECSLDAFVSNVKLAGIVGATSQLIYPIRPTSEPERFAAVQRLNERIDDWHSQLSPFLKDVKPTSLVRSLRRQSTALNLAHCHAIMHLYRPLLLGGNHTPAGQQFSTGFRSNGIARCIAAAQSALRLVDDMVKQAPTFHAYWWTHYVTFCALAVVYVWRLQRSRFHLTETPQNDRQLFELAELCHKHLAEATHSNSPSRRYSVILEELRLGAGDRARTNEAQDNHSTNQSATDITAESQLRPHVTFDDTAAFEMDNYLNQTTSLPGWLDGWQTTDWLDLDASVRHIHLQVLIFLD